MTRAARSTTTPSSACPACGGTGLADVLTVERIPGHVGILGETREAALRAPVGDIKLAWCDGCGLLYNRIFDPELVRFGPEYEATLMHSPLFRSFQEEVVRGLIERFDLRGKTVLEIGCGKGHFLRQLCALGGNDGIGIDPTIDDPGTENIEGRSLRFIQDLYSEKYEKLESDFVCCVSVFEDIARPLDLLRSVRRLVDARGAGVYFEIFNGLRAFEQCETWTVHYEQCNYFGLDTFKRMFEWSGFDVTRAAACYGGDQYLQLEAVPVSLPDTPSGSAVEREPLEMPAAVAAFGKHFEQQRQVWTQRLREFEEQGRRCVVWGSGGKGITFLNALCTAERISHVVDINPGRQGKYIPGTGQHIVSPEFLVEHPPDDVIITNGLYEDEIRKQTAELGVRARFHVA